MLCPANLATRALLGLCALAAVALVDGSASQVETRLQTATGAQQTRLHCCTPFAASFASYYYASDPARSNDRHRGLRRHVAGDATTFRRTRRDRRRDRRDDASVCCQNVRERYVSASSCLRVDAVEARARRTRPPRAQARTPTARAKRATRRAPRRTAPTFNAWRDVLPAAKKRLARAGAS